MERFKYRIKGLGPRSMYREKDAEQEREFDDYITFLETLEEWNRLDFGKYQYAAIWEDKEQ